MSEDPVARILDMANLGSRAAPYVFRDGKFFQILPDVKKGEGQSVRHFVPAVIVRNGKVAVAHKNMVLFVRDIVRTSPDTLMAIEFLVGGRVSINRDTCIEVVNERFVADGENSWKRAFLKNAALWFGNTKEKLHQPIEIQTNGGTMGIRG